MNEAVLTMMERYKCITNKDYENALKEIIQEIALLGLWRAKFFEHAAFYGGTALRILYGLDRFSEDLDFSLLKPRSKFDLTPYLNAVKAELNGMGFNVSVHTRVKKIETAVESAFIKAGTKELFIKINIPTANTSKIQSNTMMEVKLEVDTDPPGGFNTEARTLLQPIPFSVNSFALPDLFAGKLHAVLQRKWKTRVKGRDYYDFVWYIAKQTPVRIAHLEERLRQSGGWEKKEKLELPALLELLKNKFSELNVESAKSDVSSYVKDPQATDAWSRDFFISLLPSLKVTP